MMNDHLISRSRFLDALVLDADNKTDLIQVHQALEKAVISPDEARGVGEWTPTETELGFACSACGINLDEYVHGGEWVSLTKKPSYCPSCGSRMKGTEDNASP